jgi:hypothetical protein
MEIIGVLRARLVVLLPTRYQHLMLAERWQGKVLAFRGCYLLGFIIRRS